MTFLGKSSSSDCPARTRLASAVVSMPRLIPTIPPTPLSVKPNPSWMGVNWAEMMMTKE